MRFLLYLIILLIWIWVGSYLAFLVQGQWYELGTAATWIAVGMIIFIIIVGKEELR